MERSHAQLELRYDGLVIAVDESVIARVHVTVNAQLFLFFVFLFFLFLLRLFRVRMHAPNDSIRPSGFPLFGRRVPAHELPFIEFVRRLEIDDTLFESSKAFFYFECLLELVILEKAVEDASTMISRVVIGDVIVGILFVRNER